MAEQFLKHVEQYTDVLYGPHRNDEKKQAFEALQCFTQSLEYFDRCKFILDNSKSMYALLFASTSLSKLVTTHWNAFSQKADAAFDLRNYLLGYLWNRGSELPPFVLNAIVELLCRVTKLSWLEDERQRTLPADVTKFLDSTPEHGVLGLRVFDTLIQELNQRYTTHTISVHRQISILFRENGLTSIFDRVLESLYSLQSAPAPNSPQEALLARTLSLAKSCLSFDFIGTAISQANEDLATIQVPTSWRPKVEDGKIVDLFFRLYALVQPPLSTTVMETICLLTAVRNSLFSSVDIRRAYLGKLISGCNAILQNSTGLQDSDNHHQFCRVLARMKANYQLSHVVKDPNYEQWLKLTCDFSCTTFQSWQWAPNSLFYLLSLWSRLVVAHQTLKPADVTIPECSAKVLEAYITSRVNSALYLMQNPGNDDPLDDTGQLHEQLSRLPQIARCKYKEAGTVIINMFMPLAANFQLLCAQGVANDELALAEGRLAPLVYIIGSLIGGRQDVPATGDHQAVDTELVSRVFQLLALHDSRLANRLMTPNTQKLEQSLLAFIKAFRCSFIGDRLQPQSKVHQGLQEALGLTDPSTQVLELVVKKIITNLNCWMMDAEIVEASLKLFSELASSYSTSKALAKSPIVNVMLRHHTVQHFQFLGYEENSRNRTKYYATLAKLLFSNSSNVERFSEFMLSFGATFDALKSMPPDSDDCKRTFVGLMRDLRGIIAACQNKASMEMLWEWMFPKYTEVIVQGAGMYFSNPKITGPLLKLACQLSLNRSGRLNFDAASANGILLFRELSKIVVNYGTRVDTLQPPATQRYQQKLKGICNCLLILNRALSGSYVNFGVFELYGDPALNDALNITMKLALSVQHEELILYPKLKKAFYDFVLFLAKHHLKYLVTLDSASFKRIAQTMQEGLKNVSLGVFHESSQALEFIAAYFFKNHTQDTELMTRFKQQLVDLPDLFTQLLGLLFQVFLFVDAANHWAISRTMLPLILINPQYYKRMTEELINSQPIEHRQELIEAFSQLMEDVEPTLQQANREKFTRKLSTFRIQVKKVVVAI